MKRLLIRMEWGGKHNQQWMMNFLRSRFFLMNFPNCKNVNKSFEGMDPKKSNMFEILIKPLGQEPLSEVSERKVKIQNLSQLSQQC